MGRRTDACVLGPSQIVQPDLIWGKATCCYSYESQPTISVSFVGASDTNMDYFAEVQELDIPRKT